MKVPKRLASSLGWLTSRADVAARIWAGSWLLIIGCCLVFGSVILKWVQSPFSRNLSGLNLSLLHDSGVTPHITPFSVGAVGLLVLVGALFLLRKNASLLGLAAAVLIMLWAITPAQLAFRQPSMLRRLTFELAVTPALNVFTKDYLTENYGSPETLPRQLVLYSAWGRFVAACSFLRLGWYCFGIGALLIGLHAVGRLTGPKLTTTCALLCLPLGALAIVLIPPTLGQHYYSKGILAKTRGHNQEAIADFRRAMRWDSWHAQDVDLYATIGQLQRQAGLEFNSPERHIDRAVTLVADSDYERAIFEFSRAEAAGGKLGVTARREAAVTRVAYGFALYRAGGVGAAVTNWELALAEDPSLTYALPYLARGYYDLGRYQAGIKTTERLLRLIRGHNFALANAYSLAADCYAKLGDDAAARRYYSRSLALDPTLNYWALTGLVGE